MGAAASAPSQPRLTCPAQSKQTGKRCRLTAGHGTDHPGFGFCRFHLGNTVNGAKHAAKLQGLALAEGRAISPSEALQEALDTENGIFAFFGTKVSELNDDAIVTKGELNHWVKLWREANERRAHLAKTAHDAGVEERRVRLAEQLVDDLAAAFDLFATRLGVRDHPEAPAALRAALQLVEAPRALTAGMAA